MATAEGGIRPGERVAVQEKGQKNRVVRVANSNDSGLLYEQDDLPDTYVFVPWHRIQCLVATKDD